MDGTSKKGKFYRFTAAELARGVRQPDGAVAKVAAMRNMGFSGCSISPCSTFRSRGEANTSPMADKAGVMDWPNFNRPVTRLPHTTGMMLHFAVQN